MTSLSKKKKIVITTIITIILVIISISIMIKKIKNITNSNENIINKPIYWNTSIDGFTFNHEKIIFGNYSIKNNNIIVYFPNNSCAACDTKGGCGFYGYPKNMFPVDEITFGYKIKFASNFDFVKGGKLPGIYGGEKGSDGGNKNNTGFSIRIMWRENGIGEIYAYLPINQDASYKTISRVRENYGDSLAYNKFHFTINKWRRIRFYIKLNNINDNNGILKLWIDEKLVFNYEKLNYRNDYYGINGIFFNTFFGGSDISWSSTRNTNIRFSEFFIYQ